MGNEVRSQKTSSRNFDMISFRLGLRITVLEPNPFKLRDMQFHCGIGLYIEYGDVNSATIDSFKVLCTRLAPLSS